jgi:hypothetical protein
MLALYVELICDGCQISFMRHRLRDDEPQTVRQLAFDLDTISLASEWTKDKHRHYCPLCTIHRPGSLIP